MQANHAKPINQEKIKKIHSLAKVYQRKQLKHIQTLLINKKWGEAQDKLNQLINMLPLNEKLTSTQNQLIQLKQSELLGIEIEKAFASSSTLKAKIKENEFKQRNITRRYAWLYHHDSLLSERKALAKILADLSEQALKNKQLNLSKIILDEAKSLDTDISFKSLTATINRKIKNKNQASLQQTQQALISQLENAIDNENFEKIVYLEKKLNKAPYKGKASHPILMKAASMLKNNAKEFSNEADQLYRQGNIKEAISLWRQAKSLYPNLSGINDKLSRAQKVQSKLDSLRQSQTQ